MVKFCTLNGPWMLNVNLSVNDAFHPQSKRFVEGVTITAPGDSKHNDSPGYIVWNLGNFNCFISWNYFVWNGNCNVLSSFGHNCDYWQNCIITYLKTTTFKSVTIPLNNNQSNKQEQQILPDSNLSFLPNLSETNFWQQWLKAIPGWLLFAWTAGCRWRAESKRRSQSYP